MTSFSLVSSLIGYQIIVINYFSVKSVPRSYQEHFNLLHQESNQLLCSWNFLDVGTNTLIDWNDNIVDYFFEIIDYNDYLIDYGWL